MQENFLIFCPYDQQDERWKAKDHFPFKVRGSGGNQQALHMTNPPFRTILVTPDTVLGAQLIADLNADPRFFPLVAFTSLAQAYAPTEAQPPDLVICTREIAAEPEFAMFNALVEMIGCRLVSVSASGGAAAVARALGLQAPLPAARAQPSLMSAGRQRLVAIGSSTGGIEALSQILSGYPANCPPTVIVQHIKPDFLDSVVVRLNALCRANVRVAENDMRIGPGDVVVAPGLALHLEIEPGKLRCRLREGPPMSGHRPSVDHLFKSVASLKSQAVGVILTGMGRDGASGLGEMRRAGAWTIAQDAATSTVYGMPRVAHEEGAVCEVLPLPRICRAILTAAAISSEVAS